MIVTKIEKVLFQRSLSLISLTLAVQDCISLSSHMIRSGFNKFIVKKVYIENTSWKVLAYGIYARVVDVSEIEQVSAG